MRIIIEGYKDNPVVLEDVEGFILCTQINKGVKVVIDATEVFFGYAVARLQADFAESTKE